jgi:glyoxylase-like metal-dependent hydrolase (beta-lactamase superfamily II)
MAISFHRDMEFEYGKAATLSPMVRRVIARNPSTFTFHGTGTYIVGRGKVAVIDPGPEDAAHVAALLNAVRGETVTHILVTHTHGDHSPASAALKAATGAPTFGFGPHPTRPDQQPDQGGDYAFRPDVTVGDGDVIDGDGWTFAALHTPGHISNHLCFALAEERSLFSGDHVMGWSTSVISPPDGSMADYFASLRKLLPRDELLCPNPPLSCRPSSPTARIANARSPPVCATGRRRSPRWCGPCTATCHRTCIPPPRGPCWRTSFTWRPPAAS